MPSHNAGHPGQPADRGPDPTPSRDDSHKTTPATDLQADDATAADPPPAGSRDEDARVPVRPTQGAAPRIHTCTGALR